MLPSLYNLHNCEVVLNKLATILGSHITSMTSSSVKFFLQSAEDKRQKIPLPNNTFVSVGRSRTTMITDLFLSKEQVMLKADNENELVHLTPVGSCDSGCNGHVLLKGETYTLRHGDLVELRLGCHRYEITSDPCLDAGAASGSNEAEPPAKKPKHNYPIFDLHSTNVLEEKDFNANGSWEDVDHRRLLIYTPRSETPRAYIAAFDLDGTLIKTKSGNRFPKDAEDWAVNFTVVPQKLKSLHDRGYKIVIFTNQMGLGRDGSKIRNFKSKVEAIVSSLDLPIQVFVATNQSIYRKPAPGMWNVLCNDKNGDVDVDMHHSFFVGDAAGREKHWAPEKHKDHSIGDRLFALNVKLKFYTPEEYFLKAHRARYVMPSFDPRQVNLSYKPISFSFRQEVIIMVGCPGSGKSFYCKNHLIPKGYVYVNRDSLKTWQNCVKLLEDGLKMEKSVVVDNTNVDREARKKYVDVAKSHNVPCRCFVMSTSFQHAKHNNRFRELTDKSHVAVGEAVLHRYKKDYQEPILDEGFFEIIKVPFLPKFESSRNENLYKMFLLES